jgi:hypothetical protein
VVASELSSLELSLLSSSELSSRAELSVSELSEAVAPASESELLSLGSPCELSGFDDSALLSLSAEAPQPVSIAAARIKLSILIFVFLIAFPSFLHFSTLYTYCLNFVRGVGVQIITKPMITFLQSSACN